MALVLARTLHIGSAMLLVALPYFRLAVFRPVLAPDHAARHASFLRTLAGWSWGALILAALSGAAWFGLVAAEMCDPSPGAFPGLSDLTTVLWQTQFGQLWLGRLGIGAALGVTLYLAGQNKALASPRMSIVDGLVLALSAVFLITLAWAGHAAAGIHHRAFHLGIDVLHLAIGSIWPMGLVPLGLFLWSSRLREPAWRDDAEIRILTRFSRASLGAVLLLVGTGFINGWLMIGTWNALVTSTYGELLLAKVAVVVAMIGLGACNRLYLLPRMNQGPPVFRALRRTILAESFLALIVLLLVGIMGMTPPPSRDSGFSPAASAVPPEPVPESVGYR